MPNAQQDAPLLTHVNEAAELLGVSPYQVDLLITQGDLPSVRIGERTFVPTAAIHRYVAKIDPVSA